MIQAPQPDVIEAGRVLATLDDWRALMFVMSFIIVILVGVVVALVNGNRRERQDMAKERERMWSVSEKFGDAAAALGERTNNVVTELQVQRALNARSEGVISSLEEKVDGLIERGK